MGFEKKVRVLVVDDSITVRKHLISVLEASPDVEVVGEGGDGKTAIELCERLRPDVITLDMMLPVMSGLAATEYIMAHTPTPILIVSASVNRGELFHTYDALSAGAVDVLDKSNSEGLPDWEQLFVSTVKLVSRVKVITHPRARLRGITRPTPSAAPSSMSAAGERRPASLIALGASTGGPGALLDVLHALPHPFSIPLVIVIHIGAPFAPAFAEWLSGQTKHDVFVARGGERLGSLVGRVALAPADRHLVVRKGTLHLNDDPPRHSCCPSIDVLFDSMAVDLGANGAAVLLTGMGRDGAAGLLAIRNAGGFTIAQDEATSVIYGMPREAALLNAAEIILPLPAIGPALTRIPLRRMP